MAEIPTVAQGRPCTFEDVEGKACREPSSAVYTDVDGQTYAVRCPHHEDLSCVVCGGLASRLCPAFYREDGVEPSGRCAVYLCPGCEHALTNTHRTTPRSGVAMIKTSDLPPVAPSPFAEVDAERAARADVREFETGDWVMVWAQVHDTTSGHPEDMVVRIWEHNADPLVTVATKTVEPCPIGRVSPLYQQCAHITDAGLEAALGLDTYVRCQRNDQHGGQHRHQSGLHWKSKDSADF